MAEVPDLRPQLASAYEQAITVASAVRPGELGQSTPCPAMDVGALLDHTVFAARRAAALGRGQAPSTADTAPHLDLGEVPQALKEAARDAREGWADDAALSRVITMPWGESYPAAVLVGIYLVELSTHSWDLAFSTGNTGLLDEELGASTLTCAQMAIKPEYRTADGNPFGPELAAPDDATVWERLAAFMGRRPR
jgi:uncharacterized protein (TIGR03086 family)